MEFDYLFDVLNKRINVTSDGNNELKSLYNLVDKYVNDNYLFNYKDDIYYFKYKDKVYMIGYYYVYDDFYYLREAKNYEDKYVMDYKNIINNDISESQLQRKNMIDQIKSEIKFLKENGVSNDALKRSLKL